MVAESVIIQRPQPQRSKSINQIQPVTISETSRIQMNFEKLWPSNAEYLDCSCQKQVTFETVQGFVNKYKKAWLTKVKLKSKDKSQIYFVYIQVAADQQSNLIDSKQIIYVGKGVNGQSEDHLMKHLKSG